MTEEEFFTFMGEGWRKFFADNGIQYLQHNLGWSESQQKWYGWSDRAIFGFGRGDTVKKGDIAYIADTPEGLIEQRAEFFGDISAERATQARAECQILPDRSGIRILHAPLFIPMADSLEEALDHIDAGTSPEEMADVTADAVTVQKCGRGAWTARTLEDARQMALDFAAGVA